MKINKYLLALALATVLTACVAQTPPEYYTQSHYTNPTYTILNTQGNVEIRTYNSLLVAEVTEDGDRASAMKAGWQTLNGYFSGNNTTGESIAMTEPVLQFPVFRSVHGETWQPSVNGHKWIVRFYLPVEFNRETVPMPKDPNIRILETNPTTVAAISYSGPWSDENIQSNTDELTRFIADNGYHTASKVPLYAFYDSPATAPWGRHNEIMIRLADE